MPAVDRYHMTLATPRRGGGSTANRTGWLGDFRTCLAAPSGGDWGFVDSVPLSDSGLMSPASLALIERSLTSLSWRLPVLPPRLPPLLAVRLLGELEPPPDELRFEPRLSELALLTVVTSDRRDSRVVRASVEGKATWKSDEAWSPPDPGPSRPPPPSAEDADDGRITTTSSASPRAAEPYGDESPGEGGGTAAAMVGGIIRFAISSSLDDDDSSISLSACSQHNTYFLCFLGPFNTPLTQP